MLRSRTHTVIAALATAGAVGLATAGCGKVEVTVSQLPIRNDFSECDGFSGDDGVSTVDCTDGRLRIDVSRPMAAPIHLVPFRFDEPVDTLAVQADARGANGSVYGLGCATTKPDEPGRGYAFVIVPEVGASILRLDVSADGRKQAVRTLNSTEVPLEADRPRSVRAECRNVTGRSVRLTMLVDGRTVVKARDDDAVGSFRAAFAAVIAPVPGSRALFDNVNVTDGASRRTQ